ncbi:MAG: hypothetical protein V7707_17300 [Motiliproteus sp.]
MTGDQLSILKTVYSQQQSTAHILRERIAKIATGGVGLLVVIDGWLITRAPTLEGAPTVMLTLAIVVIVAVSIYAIRARYREFSAVARLIVRIETAMEIYQPGAFMDEPLYPAEYQQLGDANYEHGKNIFLSQIYILLVFGLLSLGLALVPYLSS